MAWVSEWVSFNYLVYGVMLGGDVKDRSITGVGGVWNAMYINKWIDEWMNK